MKNREVSDSSKRKKRHILLSRRERRDRYSNQIEKEVKKKRKINIDTHRKKKKAYKNHYDNEKIAITIMIVMIKIMIPTKEEQTKRGNVRCHAHSR